MVRRSYIPTGNRNPNKQSLAKPTHKIPQPIKFSTLPHCTFFDEFMTPQTEQIGLPYLKVLFSSKNSF